MKKNVKHRLKAAIALLSMAVVSTSAMAQSRELDSPADSRDNWSEFGLTVSGIFTPPSIPDPR